MTNVERVDQGYLIWPDYPAVGQFQPRPFWRGFEQCNRAGGGYTASDEVIQMIHFPLGVPINEEEKNKLRARLTTLLVDQRRQGVRFPEVTRGLLDAAISKTPLAVHERADRLLLYLAQNSRTIGDPMNLARHRNDGTHPRDPLGHPIYPPTPTNPILLEAMAWSESITFEEVEFLASYLKERGWIRELNPGTSVFQLTVDGYGSISEQQTSPRIRQAFVAMWINDETEEAFEKGLKPGIQDAGYEALRIDKKEDVVKIDDEIMSEIRRSRFLVADFTHGDDGARGGVYFEAGFAQGLGLPVFFTCRRDLVDRLHFDTRQYAHILWDNPEELRVEIKNRIRARIGSGPRENTTIL